MGAKKTSDKVGGVWFFLSLLFLFISTLLLLPAWLNTLYSEISFTRLRAAVGGAIFGIGCSTLLLRGPISTLIHELKHKVLSGLVGNKAKRVTINGAEGAFEYEYSKETAKYNAFISLAPYFLPLFVILSIPFWGFRFGWGDVTRVLILSSAWAIDLTTGIRDISPHQTDFKDIVGGFRVGLFYVILMNIIIAMILSTWIAGDWSGVIKLFSQTFAWVASTVISFRTQS